MQQNQAQDDINENLKRIAGISIALYAVMLIVYLFIGRLSPSVIIGGLFGICASMLSLLLLARDIRSIAQMDDTVLAQNRIRSSYTARTLATAGVAVAAFLLPFADGISCIIAMVFPRAGARIVQLTEARKKK